MIQEPTDISSGQSSLMDIPTLAQRLGVTERFIRRLVAERRVPFYKIGKFIRFDPELIEDWLADTRIERSA